MAVVDYPSTLIPNSMSLNLVSNTKSFSSSFNQSVQTHRFPGEHWKASLSFNNLYPYELVDLKSFVWGLGGADGRFYMPLFDNLGKPAKGTPVVLGPDQVGGLITTNGWTPNTIVLNKGDYFEINGEVKMVTANAVSSSTGTATLTFVPWLRTAAQTGQAIITDRPSGLFKLADDGQGEIDFEPGFGNISIEVVEAFYV